MGHDCDVESWGLIFNGSAQSYSVFRPFSTWLHNSPWYDRSLCNLSGNELIFYTNGRADGGGVKRYGIVVACSGFPPHFDKMFSGMIADMCIGLAYDYWARAKKNGFDQDFVFCDQTIQ